MRQTASAAGLPVMRRIATGLLVGVTAVYVVAHFLERTHTWVGFIRAFAEAAMVGALADWFAVTALFRHPLGLPIPHTAVIPKGKDRIGEGLGRFIEQNFLAPQVVAEKIGTADLVGSVARWVKMPSTGELVAGGIMRALSMLLNSFGDEHLQSIIRRSVADRVERIELAPVIGKLLAALIAQHRHRTAVDAMLRKAAEFVRDYEPQMRQTVSVRTAWLWRRLGIDQKISDKLIAALEGMLKQAAEDPDHELRTRIDAALHRFSAQLMESPQYLAEGEHLKQRLLEYPAFNDYLRGVGRDLQAQIASQAARSDSAMRLQLTELLRGAADAVLRDDALREELNRMSRAAVLRVLELQRLEVAHLIADTVKRWDAVTLTNRMEAAIGADLQYIRINGTLIGGLVGLVIHLVTTTWLGT